MNNELKLTKKDKEVMNWILKFTLTEITSNGILENKHCGLISPAKKKEIVDITKKLIKKFKEK